MKRLAFYALLVTTVSPAATWAALIVNPALPITHRVSVQIVQTALDNGSSPATLLGNATQRAAIEAGIDLIWAQAGIDIHFQPAILRYNNTFAYQGSGGGTLARPSGNLNAILTNADRISNASNLHPSVINIFFVNVVPGFSYTSKNTANGIANLGTDGIAQFVGDNLLGFAGGRDVVAQVIAHEIGHALGLKHTGDGQANLMSPNGTSAQLTAAQVQAVFQSLSRNDSIARIPSGGSGFPQAVSLGLTGDYNANGHVDAADYTVWRDSLGSATLLAADGNGNRLIDALDYSVWKSNFGRASTALGAAAAVVPEPASLVMLAVGILLAGGRRQARLAPRPAQSA